MNTSLERIQKELQCIDWSLYNECGISIEAVNDNLKLLKGKISGPSDTPYEGGNFILEISIPDKYPFAPPSVRFVTKIWHPSINSISGEVHFGNDWHFATTLSDILISLQELLSTADTKSALPLDPAVGKQRKDNPDMFKDTARYWAQTYAGAPAGAFFPDFESKVRQLMDKDVSENTALRILSAYSWDLEKAKAILNV